MVKQSTNTAWDNPYCPHGGYIEGTLDSKGLRRALTLLKDFDHIELTPSDLEWANDQLIRFHLSHNIGMMDCLIASASQRLQIPLYTTNLKHFTPLLGSLAQKPY
jgi:predicted nucleic acid-binding protein